MSFIFCRSSFYWSARKSRNKKVMAQGSTFAPFHWTPGSDGCERIVCFLNKVAQLQRENSICANMVQLAARKFCICVITAPHVNVFSDQFNVLVFSLFDWVKSRWFRGNIDCAHASNRLSSLYINIFFLFHFLIGLTCYNGSNRPPAKFPDEPKMPAALNASFDAGSRDEANGDPDLSATLQSKDIIKSPEGGFFLVGVMYDQSSRVSCICALWKLTLLSLTHSTKPLLDSITGRRGLLAVNLGTLCPRITYHVPVNSVTSLKSWPNGPPNSNQLEPSS